VADKSGYTTLFNTETCVGGSCISTFLLLEGNEEKAAYEQNELRKIGTAIDNLNLRRGVEVATDVVQKINKGTKVVVDLSTKTSIEWNGGHMVRVRLADESGWIPLTAVNSYGPWTFLLLPGEQISEEEKKRLKAAAAAAPIDVKEILAINPHYLKQMEVHDQSTVDEMKIQTVRRTTSDRLVYYTPNQPFSYYFVWGGGFAQAIPAHLATNLFFPYTAHTLPISHPHPPHTIFNVMWIVIEGRCTKW